MRPGTYVGWTRDLDGANREGGARPIFSKQANALADRREPSDVLKTVLPGDIDLLSRWGRALVRNLIGWTLFVVGVLFGWLPIVQGVAFVVIGLALADWPGKRRAFRWLRTFRFFRKIDAWSHRHLGFRLPEHRDARRERKAPSQG